MSDRTASARLRLEIGDWLRNVGVARRAFGEFTDDVNRRGRDVTMQPATTQVDRFVTRTRRAITEVDDTFRRATGVVGGRAVDDLGKSGGLAGDSFVRNAANRIRNTRGPLALAASASGAELLSILDRAGLAAGQSLRGQILAGLLGGGEGGSGGGGGILDALGEVADVGLDRIGQRSVAWRAAQAAVRASRPPIIRDVHGRLHDESGRFISEGQAAARGFADALRAGQPEVAAASRQLGEQGGAEAAEGWHRNAAGRIVDARGRFVSAARVAAAGWADGMARAGDEAGERLTGRTTDRIAGSRGRFASVFRSIGVAGVDAFGGHGEAAAQRWVDGGLGRLRASAGRFASQGAALGRALTPTGGGGGIGIGNPRTFFIVAGGAAAAVASLQLIPPVLSAIGGGLGAIPGLAAGATASLGSLALGMMGVGDALGDVFNPKPAAGGGGGLDDTAAKTRRLAAAQRELKDAQRDLSRAWIEGARNLRDLKLTVSGAEIDLTSALIAVEEAEDELRLARAAGDPIDLKVRRAEVGVKEANQALQETRNRLGDLKQDYPAAAAAGVAGTDAVTQAMRRQQAATDSLLDAQEAMAASAGGAAALATAYDKLSPNAKKFVDEIKRLKPELVGIQQLAQDRLFAGFDKDLREFAGVGIPFARKQIDRFATDWSQLIRATGRAVMQPSFLLNFDAALASSDRFFDGFTARADSSMRMWGQLMAGSTPFIDRFGDRLFYQWDRFTSAVDRADQNGDLDKFFADAAVQAEALVDLSAELLRTVVKIGGSQQGSHVLRDMADAVKRFNDSAHDMQSVRGIIDTGNAALRGIWETLKLVGELLGETLADPATRDAIAMFFKVVHSGVAVLGELVHLFQLIPDEFQSVILLAFGLYAAWGKLNSITEKLGGAAGRMSERLATVGPAGEKAGRGLQAMATWAGRATTALFALEAIDVVLKTMEQASVDADRLGASLDELARSGKVSGEAAREFGVDMKGFAIDARMANGPMSDVVRWAEGLPVLGTAVRNFTEDAFGHSATRATENMKAMDEQLAAMVRNGNVEGARSAFSQLAAIKMELPQDFLKQMPAYAAAIEEVNRSADPAVRAQRRLELQAMATADSWEEAARQAGGLKQEIDDLTGGSADWMEAESRWRDALDDATDAMREGHVAVDARSDAGRRGVDTVLRLRDETARATQAAFDHVVGTKGETAALVEANRVFSEGRQKMVDFYVATGKSRTEAEKLATQLLQMPKNIGVNLSLKFTGWTNFGSLLSSVGLAAQLAAAGFKFATNRWGGVYEPARDGLLSQATVYSSRSPGRFMIAEPETEGEAFIPKRGDRARSIGIGREAMSWYGMDVVPQSQGYGRPAARVDYGRPAMSLSSVPRGPSAAEIGAAVAAQVARMVPASDNRPIEVPVILNGVEIARAVASANRDLARRG